MLVAQAVERAAVLVTVDPLAQYCDVKVLPAGL